jgi:2-keto-4-pentenoate hydratase/2-oxohepta-3-ene-1,7-dioic acid hydratase in catechol pathway
VQIVNYQPCGGQWHAGVALEGFVVPAAVQGADGPRSVLELLASGRVGVEHAFEVAAEQHAAQGADVVAMTSIRLGPPVPDPDKIICLGLNYREHAAESGMQLPESPILFAKFRNALVGPEDDVVLPRQSAAVDFEGELAVVIGTRCKNVPEADALTCVAGYMVMNDVSARDLQLKTSQWLPGKAIDTFAPTGPGITPAWEIPDPQDLLLTTRVNGEVVQQASTAEMIFSVAGAIEWISSLMTLEPGDIIATGTPAGVGATRKPPLWLSEGDLVEVEIDRIGAIRNKFVRDQRTRTLASAAERSATP